MSRTVFVYDLGFTEQIPLPAPARPDWNAALAAWLIYAPWAHPLWQYYQLAVVHLRHIDGVKPAVLRTPDAAHELMVVALDPQRIPAAGLTAADCVNAHPGFLLPVSLCEQFEGTTDAEMVRLAELCAHACARATLSPEPNYLQREGWRVSLWRTLEHIRHGGHPFTEPEEGHMDESHG